MGDVLLVGQKEIKSEFYHDNVKGCNTREIKRFEIINRKEVTLHFLKCDTHKLEACRCGWEFGKHYGYKTKTIAQNIKDECARCYREFRNSVDYYETHGNFCAFCIREVNEALEKNKKKKRFNLRDYLK